MHALVHVKWLMQHIQRCSLEQARLTLKWHVECNHLMHVFKLDLKIQCSLYDVPSPVHVNKCMDARMHCIRYAQINVP